MTGEDLQMHLHRLDLHFNEAAVLFECHERTVRRWAHGEMPVPTAVGLLLIRLMSTEVKEFRTATRRKRK